MAVGLVAAEHRGDLLAKIPQRLARRGGRRPRKGPIRQRLAAPGAQRPAPPDAAGSRRSARCRAPCTSGRPSRRRRTDRSRTTPRARRPRHPTARLAPSTRAPPAARGPGRPGRCGRADASPPPRTLAAPPRAPARRRGDRPPRARAPRSRDARRASPTALARARCRPRRRRESRGAARAGCDGGARRVAGVVGVGLRAPERRLERRDLGGGRLPGAAVDQELDAVSPRDADQVVAAGRRGRPQAFAQRGLAPRRIAGVVLRRGEIQQQRGALARIVPLGGQGLFEPEDRAIELAAVEKPPRLLGQEPCGHGVSGPERDGTNRVVERLLVRDAAGERQDLRARECHLHARLRGEREPRAIGVVQQRQRRLEAALASEPRGPEPQRADGLLGRSVRVGAPPRGRPARGLAGGPQ